MANESGAGERPAPPRSIEEFLETPPHDLAAWRWLWQEDRSFPVRSHRPFYGWILVLFKRLFRPLVKAPLNDLWDRQRAFNQILLQHLEARAAEAETRDNRIGHVEAFISDGLKEVMHHNDALFSRVDQKLDRYRREARDLWGRLGAALALVETGDVAPLARVREEHGYLDLEKRFRGTEEEIRQRISLYLPRLQGKGEVIDLGCGRGESLEVLAEAGIPARGVDSSALMVKHCREKGLTVEEGDLFEALARTPESSLGGVVSLHVVEHLPPETLDRLGRLAWRALAPSGVLILETPNPLSLTVAARNFWLDPTHRRPVHPAYLKLVCELAGFDRVEHLELRPFSARERLPEIDITQLPEDQKPLADSINRLRDRLDELLFGCQDYAVVATKSD